MTMIGLTQGMQPIVSYLDGKSDIQKRDKVFKLTLKYSIVIGLVALIVTLTFRRELISMFIDDTTINDLAQKYLP